MRYLVLALLAVLSPPAMDRPDCKKDCRKIYQAAIEACETELDDHDSDGLKVCVTRAKGECNSCLEECED
jgi:hypothetical protein